MSLKRKRQDDRESIKENEQPVLNGSQIDVSLNLDPAPETPQKRRRGRPPGSTNKPKSTPGTPRNQDTPQSKQSGRKLFGTPSKAKADAPSEIGTPIVRNADRSARRKSVRTLIERSVAAADFQEENAEDEDFLASQIWDAEEAEENDLRASSDEEPIADPAVPVTPSKRERKGPRRKRTPTPPQDLPPHEQYFFQNRAGNNKTSNNTISSLFLLSHEQYHKQIKSYKDPHESSYAYLHSLHSRSFPQWRFELSQSFSICLYGYGSKRHLTDSFAKYLYSQESASPPNIIVTNGYIPTLTIRQILTTIAGVVYDCPVSSLPKLSTQPREIVDSILHELNTSPPTHPLYLLINSLDATPLRRSPIPALLAQLSASPHIRLLATCDTPNFPLLWDTNLRDQYNWAFHDTTTFISYAGVEIEDVVEEVNELMGRSGRRIKGKEGVGFVLKSLPENARSLYRVLVAELLSQQDSGLDDMQVDLDDVDVDGEDENALIGTPHKSSQQKGKATAAATAAAGGACIEYRTLYQKVVEEFICSNEMGFRQLLKEFHDHQMIVSRRDATGAEMLGVPFRRDEMEAILDDLMG
ncbi:MAG: hypothetical protein L6R38_002958 [Xanthoria sp. 2 TBL-2021]|nr:MAG: hypothetical protein L6R38_002958 [Xanthoria sp. 2 TBL-2021]